MCLQHYHTTYRPIYTAEIIRVYDIIYKSKYMHTSNYSIPKANELCLNVQYSLAVQKIPG